MKDKNTEEIIVDAKILKTVTDSLNYSFIKDILVKPMPQAMVTKTITDMIETDKLDKDGYKTYETKTEVKDVESEYTKGIILAVGTIGCDGYEVGDVVVFAKRLAREFDLFKDSLMVKPYDIIAFDKK